MTIPVEILSVLLGIAASAIIGLQVWILLEIVNIKIRLADYDALKNKVETHEGRITHIEAYCNIEPKI